jgi:hypothetical protein
MSTEIAESIPKSFHVGEITVGNAIIPAAVLELPGQDPIRLLTQEGFLKAVGRAGKAKGGQGASVDGLPAFLAAKNLKPFMPKDLVGSTMLKPIVFKTPSGATAYGYNADLLAMVCETYIDADHAGALAVSQEKIAAQAQILHRGLARVGIAALIDEATGYQDPNKRALQQILEKYLKDQYSPWTKRFSYEFYVHLFRLKGMPLPPLTSGKKPSFVGHWTNDVVYSRLAPGVLQKLRELNPAQPGGKRKHKHHQFFTEDYGVPELQQHLFAIEALMRSSSSWMDFHRRIERAFPKCGDTIPLDLGEEN